MYTSNDIFPLFIYFLSFSRTLSSRGNIRHAYVCFIKRRNFVWRRFDRASQPASHCASASASAVAAVAAAMAAAMAAVLNILLSEKFTTFVRDVSLVFPVRGLDSYV